MDIEKIKVDYEFVHLSS